VTTLENVWCGWDSSSCGSAYGAMRSFNGGISMWDVSKVTNMHYTFLKASAFNGDISKWDVGKVTTMQESKLIRIFENDLT
jgi:surface protein